MKKLLLIILIGVFIVLKPINAIIKDSLGNIIHRGSVVTGIIATDNGDGSYDVFISESDRAYPKVRTLSQNPDLAVDDKVRILYKDGCRELPIILPPVTVTAVSYDLIACDSENHKIWKFDGISNTIKETLDVSSIVYFPTATTIANGNLITFGYAVAQGYDLYICVHDGFSTTVTEYIVPPEGISDSYISALYFDGTNLMSMNWLTKKIYIHDGISASVSSSFATPSTLPRGMVIVNGDLITIDANSDKVYIHNGITASIKSSFNCITPDNSTYGQPAPNGLAYDGINLILGDNGRYNVEDDAIIVYEGITSVINRQIIPPAGCERICGLVVFR